MAVSTLETGKERPLDILGIGDKEEFVYRWLLANSGATVTEIAPELNLSRTNMQKLLDSIESKGLVTHTVDRPRRYISVSPDIAIEALVRYRREDLDRAQSMVAELQKQIPREKHNHEHDVELLNSLEAERQVFEQMHLTAQEEVIVLVRPPIRVSRLEGSRDCQTQRQAQSRGVRYRSIVDAAWLALPGAAQRSLADINAGEEMRSMSTLPFKMAMVDRHIAIIPLDYEGNSPSLLVRSSALLNALHSLFELLWERAAPVSFTDSNQINLESPTSQLPRDATELVSLLAAGMNDKGIASELGISSSTFSRRIVELMKSLDARTRFQLGWLAATRLSPDR